MYQGRKKLSFFGATALLYLAGSLAYAVTPTIFVELGMPDWFFGVSFGFMSAGNFLFAPFWGQMMTYLGTRRVSLVSAIGCAVGQSMLAIFTSVGGMLFARFLAGFFAGGCYTCAAAHIVNICEGEERGKYLAFHAALTSVCAAFSYLIGGLLGEVFPRLAIYVQAAVLVIDAFWLYFATGEDAKYPKSSLTAKELFKNANPLSSFKVGKQFLTVSFIILFTVSALQNLGATVFDQTFNYYLHDQFGLSSGYNGVIRGVMGIIALFANGVIAMRILKKGAHKKALPVILLFASLTMLSAIMFGNIIPFIAANVIFYAATTACVPILQQSASEIGKNVAGGQLMSFFNAVRSLGGIVSAFAAGFLYDVDPKYPFIFGFGAFLLATAGAVIFKKRESV